MKRKINVWDYAGHILEQTGKGVLLTTKADGQVNTMTIGWGTLGIEWGKPIYTVFVRESRHTKALLDKSLEFTVNVPWGEVDKAILSLCGTRSGRDVDKIAELGLTLEEPEAISVPAIRELPLTLECRVIYRQDQEPTAVNEENTARYYPRSEEFPQGDYHTAYYGQILAAYIVE
jgi:flavin reductase (DIM6/NTAB) family NADH-FMN oxidoreductase RutF